MKEFLESEEFYNLMQDYRNASIIHQADVIEKYEAVKTAISNRLEKLVSPHTEHFDKWLINIEIMKYRIKKALKALGLYNVMCRTFLRKRKFIIQPFVYIDKDGIARGKITDKVRWLAKFETETQCFELAESEFWKEAKKKYGFYDAIWLF